MCKTWKVQGKIQIIRLALVSKKEVMTSPAQQVVPIIAPVQHQVPQGEHKSVRRIALIQLATGALTFILGIATVSSTETLGYDAGAGMWNGVFIMITAFFGICSVRKKSGNLDCAYLIFNIIAMTLTVLSEIFFISAVLNYGITERKRKVALGLYVPMMILLVIEFILSITASVYSGRQSINCCPPQLQQIMFQPQAPFMHGQTNAAVQTSSVVYPQQPQLMSQSVGHQQYGFPPDHILNMGTKK